MNPSEKTPVFISDTTLRDGEQMRGVAYSSGNKLAIARQLARLNVDEIEAGFPSISPDEMEAIEAIAADVKGKRIAVLVRALKGDIDAAKQALRKADRPVVTIFCPASDRQIRAKLNRTREEALSMATQAIRYAKGHFPEVSFAPEDATRAAKVYLHQLIRAAIEAGATTISISDTVGYAQPSEFGLMIREICAITRNSADLRAHCHNDLGLAVANSLAAMENGANVISCTVNGMGERAGNAPLEEVVMAIEVRQDYYRRYTNIRLAELYPTSQLISALSGVGLPGNKPIVGGNAFVHVAGIHQQGILRDRMTYEIMQPQTIGAPEPGIILGKHSGLCALRARLRNLGLDQGLDEDGLAAILAGVKSLAITCKEISDADLLRLLAERQAPASWN